MRPYKLSYISTQQRLSIPASNQFYLDLPYQCYGVGQIRPGYWVPGGERWWPGPGLMPGVPAVDCVPPMLLEEIFQWDFMQFDLSSVWTEQLTLYASFHHPMKLWVYNNIMQCQFYCRCSKNRWGWGNARKSSRLGARRWCSSYIPSLGLLEVSK